MDYNQVIQKLKGTVVPVPAQFHDDLTLHLDAYSEHIAFLLAHDVKIFYLAHSASEFGYMTQQERFTVAEKVVSAVGGKGIVIVQAVGGNWIDEQIQEGRELFARGAAALVVKPIEIREGGAFFHCKYTRGGYAPDRHDEYYVEYMTRFAEETGGPLIFHDKPFSSGQGLSMDALGRIVSIPAVVGIKAHVGDPCTRQAIYSRFGDSVACFDGFGKTLEFWSLLWGASGRHSCWSWFDPDHDNDFYEAMMQGDLSRAVALVNREWPLAHVIRRTGFRGYKEVMHLVGLPSGPVRLPGEELNRAQRLSIREAAREVGLIG